MEERAAQSFGLGASPVSSARASYARMVAEEISARANGVGPRETRAHARAPLAGLSAARGIAAFLTRHSARVVLRALRSLVPEGHHSFDPELAAESVRLALEDYLAHDFERPT